MLQRIVSGKHLGRRVPKTGHNSKEQLRQISVLCAPLLNLADYAIKHQGVKRCPYSALLRDLLKESTALEEIIDNYGAQKNETWYPFREAIASVKLFSSVCNCVLHIRNATPRYNLIDVGGTFYKDTEASLHELTDAVTQAARILLFQAVCCGIRRTGSVEAIELMNIVPPAIKLPVDRKSRHIKRTGETVVYLSTAFLNMSKDRDVAMVLKKRESDMYESCIPEAVNEEMIRIAEARVHNLQSHYDTYIFETDIESQNRNLPILRGHISVTFRLLEVATELAHYYERHMSELRRRIAGKDRFPLPKNDLLRILFGYLLRYARVYTDSASNLCRAMIHDFSETREIKVPIPNYRGFHVRPSTLIAKIVAHYGSPVAMILNGQEYNAGVTFDLFRANEEINALKRRHIGEILQHELNAEETIHSKGAELVKKLQILFLQLSNSHRIILYDTDLTFEEFSPDEDEPLINFVSRYIRHYMSVSKIDIQSTFTAVFRGDNRALIDLKLLAENGYGEDRYGNNIVLPPELSHLRE